MDGELPQVSMTDLHERLKEAFGPWSRGEFPDAKCIGDVVEALADVRQAELIDSALPEAS